MTAGDSNDDVESGRVPPHVARRERWIVVGLAVAVAAIAVLGFATVPTDAELLGRARAAEDPRARVRAMNALVLRGYWDERPVSDLREFLAGSSPELDEFVRRMHGSLLRDR